MSTYRNCVSFHSFHRPAFIDWVSAALIWVPVMCACGAENQVLRGQVPAAVTRMQPVGNLAASTRLGLAVGLPLRNREALTNLLHELYDPASPNYRHFLTPEQFAEQFGPSERDYEALIAFARASGLEVAGTHPNRLLLDVKGTAAQVERACHVKLRLYQHPTENRMFYAPDGEPSLELAVPVLGISGLNDYALPRPRLQTNSLSQLSIHNVQPNAGSGPNGAYLGNDFRAAYVPDSTLTGSGQVVGLVQFDGYNASDITYFEQEAGLPNVPLQNVLLDGFDGRPTGSGGEVEVCLDVQMAMSMAPGLSEIIVYMAGPYGNWHDMLNRIATDNLAKQVSCSWYSPGGGADPVADQIWQQMASQGQSFFNASGDYDAFTKPVDFPGETPYITQVGGTTLSTTGPGGAWTSEKVWNWNNGFGSGGGISTRYTIPDWQTNAITPASQGSTAMRNIPDVALTADNVYVRANARDYNVGGTSCAAPLWAGFMALVNQCAAQAGKGPLGFVNPAVYALGQRSIYASAFHDITIGNNESIKSPTRFSAVTGYDLCTGWGTPTGARLITALATPDPLVIVPEKGFDAIGVAGGPFDIISQTFLLTNSGAGSLDWSLVSTSAWLSASAGGGTLISGGPAASVIIGLNSAASNLVTGFYTTAVWFTNLSDNVGQSVPFSLAILEAPVITNQPTDLAVLEGATAMFSVGATGSAPLAYYWRFNGAKLADGGKVSGSASNLLTIANVSAAEVGTYLVLVSNPVGVVVSVPAQLTITPSAPVIVTQPTSQTAYWGQKASFFVSAIGNSPLYYQWSFNGTNLDDATDARLTLTNLRFDQAGNYAVVVSNGLGSTPSSNAVLTVLPAPPCAAAPAGLISWWQGEANALDQIGTNDGTLVGDTSFGPGEVGNGFVLDGRGDLVTVGNPASLRLQDFTIEAWVKRASADVVSYGTYGNGIVFSYGYGGYGFYLDSAGRLALTRIGVSEVKSSLSVTDTSFHHVAVTKSGSGVVFYLDGVPNTTAYNPVFVFSTIAAIGARADNLDNSFLGTIDEVSVYNRALLGAEVQAIYNAGVSGKCAVPPSILAQPADQVAAIGKNVTFDVTAWGTRPLSYQWFKDGGVFTGATNSTFTINNAQTNDAGIYSVLVTNIAGSALSSNATLTLLEAPFITAQPQDTNVLAGETITFSVTAGGAPPLSYQWRKDGISLTWATNSTCILLNVQTNDAGVYSVLVTNRVGTVLSSNAVLTVWQPPVILAQPQDETVPAAGTAFFSVTACGTPPLAYQWSWNGTNLDGATTASLVLTNVHCGHAGNYAVVVTNSFGSTPSSNAVLTVLPAPLCAPVPAGLVSWWQGEGNALDQFGANDGTLVGNTTFSLGEVGQGFVLDGLGDLVTVGNPAGLRLQDFTIEAWLKRARTDVVSYGSAGNGIVFSYGFGGYGFYLDSGGRLALTMIGLSEVKSSLSVTDTNFHHVAVTKSGSMVVFYVDGISSVAAAYNPGFAFNTVAAIGGRADLLENSFLGTIDEVSVYSRALLGSEVQAIYNAGAAGKCGAPRIVTQPQAQSVIVGSNVTFSVAASGVAPLNYQWLFNGTNLAAATSSALTLTNVQPKQAGNYAVWVLGYGGTTLSSNAALTVLVPPRITRQPVRQLVQAGCGATFNVVATGTEPLSYLWRKDGVALNGQTGSTLTIAGAQTNDLGAYCVVVTNICGSVVSSNAVLAWDHAPVAMPDVIERFAAGGVRVRASALAANDTDADGDSLAVVGVSLTSAAGGIVGLNNGWVYYQPPAGFTNTDTFTYTVSDGHCYGWSVGVVTVQTRGDDTPVSHLRIDDAGDGSYRIGVDGRPGATYRLQHCENLSTANWQDLAAGTADAFGVFEYTHQPPKNAPAWFYRAIWP